MKKQTGVHKLDMLKIIKNFKTQLENPLPLIIINSL